MSKVYTWEFPLPRTHTGMLQGNGVMGAMIWGEGGVLRVTVGRADFWDHRGGVQWTEAMSYAAIRAHLEAGDEKALGTMFSPPPKKEGEPQWPTVLPLGRIELDFGPDACLQRGELDLETGLATVIVTAGGAEHRVELTLAMESQVLAVALPELPVEVKRVPAWEYVGHYLQSISFREPELFDCDGLAGWVQERPADLPLCLGYRVSGRTLLLSTAYGDDPAAARTAVRTVIAQAGGIDGVGEESRAWWRAYWADVPAVRIPNERLQFLYDYGMYKFAGLTQPDGVPATLQGPWIEEYQMPPWSSDYHFNINVQMCYWPAYHGNRLSHLKPLFEMIASWTDRLRHNARVFAHIEDGRMLPHAVDDRCTCIGGFWAGSLDHGCTAWVAQMMYRYYRYTLDLDFLRDTAYPFIAGAMRVFQVMLERDGDRLTLPVSVSPEYHTKFTHSPWGRDASFQLACIHRLGEDLLEAADALDVEPDPTWQEMLDRLPHACLIGDGADARIAIWDGIALEESHRHHSHLAGITPFDIFELEDPAWRRRVGRSLDEWIYHGTGLWSGWCVPWAAMIHMRFGKGEAAELLLESWQRVYTNEGHGTLHDAHIPGFTLFGQGYADPYAGGRRNEVMQMDAGMSCTAAIQEMLLHTRRGVTYLFAGAPHRWRTASFTGMRTDGAFLVSAVRTRGVVEQVTVESPAGGVFRLANPWEGPVEVRHADGNHEVISGDVLAIPTGVGETVTLSPLAEEAVV